MNTVPQNILDQMRADWNERGATNADYFVATEHEHWTEEEFLRSGKINVEDEILTDLTNICGGREPKALTVVEIGCGSGRMTGALADLFGHVHSFDISSEMLERARGRHQHRPNVTFHLTPGDNLPGLDNASVDLAFSFIVFQHIPSRQVIDSYVAEVARVLKPGTLFKFQVQGAEIGDEDLDTWNGVGFTVDQARELAERNGFEMRFHHGAGEQYFRLWFVRR